MREGKEYEMIEIETIYTYESYKQYYWFSLFRGKYYRYGKAVLHFFTVLAIALVILSVTLHYRVLTSIIAAIGAVILISYHILAFVRPKRYVRQSPSFFQTGHTFIFDEDSLSIMQTGEIASGSSTAQYSALIKVYETREMFYVYVSPVQAFLLAKKDIVKGTPEELRGLLQSKLPHGKYILCK